MTLFRVWAPSADEVEIELMARRLAMRPAPGDWFEIDVPEAGHGTQYAYRLDGGEPLPDPRSRHQPRGVDGPSAVVDPATFAWTDHDWHGRDLATSVVYELHAGTFTPEGTFDAAIGKLPHLADLGVGHVEVMPVNAFPGDHGWGYDGTGLYAVHEPYGGPGAFARFVDAAHAHGLGVILDVVYNHLGPAGNHLDRFGPYFTSRYATPWGRAVNYDGAGSDEVREFVFGNALMWLRDYHVDGLRLDAVHAIVDTSAVPLLEELRERVGPDAILVAESDLNDPRILDHVDAQWSDDFHHALHVALTGERSGYYLDYDGLPDLATALRDVFVYARRHSAYRGRRHGRAAGDLPRTRFLGYLQNHDQVGNRALGERSAELMSESLLRIGAALVLLSPFVPLLFQGEEWGATTPFRYFTSHEDEDLAETVRTGRREEFAVFGWKPEDVPDPQDPATFEASKLDWSEPRREPHKGLLDWHRELIALRRQIPPGAPTDVGVDGRTITMRRGDLTVVCDLDAETVDVR